VGGEPGITLERIEDLLRAPATGDEAPTLEHLEETLTAGYAQALALEAERWRIERRLAEVARDAHLPGASRLAEELASLAKRLRNTDAELARLRATLGSLQTRAREARTSA
jgi:HD-like signal output (HDOD) protein